MNNLFVVGVCLKHWIVAMTYMPGDIAGCQIYGNQATNACVPTKRMGGRQQPHRYMYLDNRNSSARLLTTGHNFYVCLSLKA